MKNRRRLCSHRCSDPLKHSCMTESEYGHRRRLYRTVLAEPHAGSRRGACSAVPASTGTAGPQDSAGRRALGPPLGPRVAHELRARRAAGAAGARLPLLLRLAPARSGFSAGMLMVAVNAAVALVEKSLSKVDWMRRRSRSSTLPSCSSRRRFAPTSAVQFLLLFFVFNGCFQRVFKNKRLYLGKI